PQEPGAGETDRLNFVLKSPQPNSSWSRTRWLPVARELGQAPFAAAATDEGRPAMERIRAVEVLTEVFGGPDPATMKALTAARSAPVRARTAWAMGRMNPESPAEIITTFLNDPEPLVNRFALEALITTRDRSLLDRALPKVAMALSSPDPSVRAAAVHLIVRFSPEQRKQLGGLLEHSPVSRVCMALGELERNAAFHEQGVEIAMRVLQDSTADLNDVADALRLLQLALGDVGPKSGVPGMFESYTARADLSGRDALPDHVRSVLADRFPFDHERCDRECIRIFAMLGSADSALISKLHSGITPQTTPAEDIHRLAALARMSGQRTEKESVATAEALVNLDHKIRQMGLNQDSNWDERVGELYAELSRRDQSVPTLIAGRPGFGLPGHVLFLSAIPADRQEQAVAGFARQVAADPGFEWNDEVVAAFGRSSNPEYPALLRSQIDNLSVQDAVLRVLTENPQPADRPLILRGLESYQTETIARCIGALLKLPKNNDAAEQYLLLKSAGRLMHDEAEFRVREQVMRLLENNTGRDFGFVYGAAGYRLQADALLRCEDVLTQRYPGYSPPLEGGDAAQHVLSALSKVAWSDGNAESGRLLFSKFACTRCHSGRTALGPDLHGVTKRFSQRDLFIAIVDPNRDVSARYQTTSVETKAGKVYSGLVVYESVDGILIRDADHKTFRIESSEIESITRRRASLMPNGLLRNVSRQDLADLNAYLQTL
ncbi:MAG: HEAT repeat domain-containing protein, partial [Planctomycetaceae bacterium]|nr:HEAT repeat domain-containing protein [Planctomycetaceae bacterium]